MKDRPSVPESSGGSGEWDAYSSVAVAHRLGYTLSEIRSLTVKQLVCLADLYDPSKVETIREASQDDIAALLG